MTSYLFPEVAPLSQPMMSLIIKENTTLTTLPSESEWRSIVRQVEEKRDIVSQWINPVVATDTLSTSWFIETLSQFGPHKALNRPISAETVSRWRSNGLLIYKEKNHPDAASVAAILTLRLLIQDKQRQWTPTQIKGEPAWWCWRQDTPQSPIIPCGIPLSPELPRHALLWTTWTGAAWDPSWLQFGQFGAARWAGIEEQEGSHSRYWSLNEEELILWGGTDIMKYEQGLLDSLAKQARHTVATLLLLQHASSKLSEK